MDDCIPEILLRCKMVPNVNTVTLTFVGKLTIWQHSLITDMDNNVNFNNEADMNIKAHLKSFLGVA